MIKRTGRGEITVAEITEAAEVQFNHSQLLVQLQQGTTQPPQRF